MLSIGIFTYSVKPRGSVVHAACLAEALLDEGAHVTLYALGKNGDRFFRPLRCPLVLFPAGPAPAEPDRLIEQRIGELHAGLASLATRHDLYHAEDCLTASALVTAAPRLSPVVRTVHHVEHFSSPYLAACQRRSVEASDLVLSVSARTAREVASEFGRTSRVVHNGVDLERFGTVPAAAPALAAQLKLTDDDVLVLSVGGVEERKNTLRSLEAMSTAMAKNPRIFWVVAGGASIWDHSELEQRFDARTSELPEAVRRRIARVGAVDEATLTWLYQRSAVVLSPSLHEGFCLCALEGLAAGAAVVASRSEPFTDFIDDSVARLVDPAEISAIEGAVTTLAADTDLRARLAAAGRVRAREYTWRRTALAHLEAYRSLAAERRNIVAVGPLAAATGV